MKGNNKEIRRRRAAALRRLRGELKKRDREILILIDRLADYQLHGKLEDVLCEELAPSPTGFTVKRKTSKGEDREAIADYTINRKPKGDTALRPPSIEALHRRIAEYVAWYDRQGDLMKNIVARAAKKFGVPELTVYEANKRNRHIFTAAS